MKDDLFKRHPTIPLEPFILLATPREKLHSWRLAHCVPFGNTPTTRRQGGTHFPCSETRKRSTRKGSGVFSQPRADGQGRRCHAGRASPLDGDVVGGGWRSGSARSRYCGRDAVHQIVKRLPTPFSASGVKRHPGSEAPGLHKATYVRGRVPSPHVPRSQSG